MKISTWNVNSLRVRLAQVCEWIAEHQPDVLCLQETKVTDEHFPKEALEALGYELMFTGQKTFNGVAILSKFPMQSRVDNLLADDVSRRLLAVTVCDIRIVTVYVPNGAFLGSDKFEYKLAWLTELQAFLAKELSQHKKLIVLGDFNIAPEDQDVHDPLAWEGSVLVSPQERAAFTKLLSLGFSDAFRLCHQEETQFSWWDYRAAAFVRNRGLRIDHILLSDALSSRCKACEIDKTARGAERPSDHAPVTVWIREE